MERHMPGLRNSGFSVILILLLITAAVLVTVLAFIFFKKPDISTPPSQSTPAKEAESSPLIQASPSSTAAPVQSTPTSMPSASPSSDLSAFKNEKYGFELSYPKSYKALSSKDDLAAYQNGVLLLYTGGQAYDVIIEVWDTKAEYETNYGPRVSELTVIESKDKFITLLDNTHSPESQKIIESFKLL